MRNRSRSARYGGHPNNVHAGQYPTVEWWSLITRAPIYSGTHLSIELVHRRYVIDPYTGFIYMPISLTAALLFRAENCFHCLNMCNGHFALVCTSGLYGRSHC